MRRLPEALAWLGRNDDREHRRGVSQSAYLQQRTHVRTVCVRIMTYNVHSCRGMDGAISHERIAEVIERYNPDVVALQELDLGRERSGRLDQTRSIAEL